MLDNLRSAVRSRRGELVEKLKEIGDVDLATFLSEAAITPIDVYSGSSPGWNALRRAAGFVSDEAPNEVALSRALRLQGCCI